MAHDGYVALGGEELFNASRTVQLAEAMGIDVVWLTPEQVQWIEDSLGGADYDLVATAPWYDAGYPESAEFAGFIPLSMPGLDDSTRESVVVEFVTDGGNSQNPRNKVLNIVASVAIIASTDRGAKYGKRWLDRRLRAAGTEMYCSGSELRYFDHGPDSYAGLGELTPPLVHRRDVSLGRAATVTRKHLTSCSSTWLVSFTWNANDPYEYGDPVPMLEGLGGAVSGSRVLASGTEAALVGQSCPKYDYSPIYDPLFPALVEAPTAPDFYPEGWTPLPGATYKRFWARVDMEGLDSFEAIPMIELTAAVEARMTRVSFWRPDVPPGSAACTPLWQVILTYIPAEGDEGAMFLDSEQKAAYLWLGVGERVRRSDSLVYSYNAAPVQWSSISGFDELLVTLDVFDATAADDLRMSLAMVPKSD